MDVYGHSWMIVVHNPDLKGRIAINAGLSNKGYEQLAT